MKGLRRVLGPADAAWLVAGNMIGAGIFVTPGLVAGHLPGPAWQVAAWLLGGLLALAGAAIYGELGARLPEAGGDYQYLSRALGRGWGFLTAWGAFLLTFSAAAAAMAVVSVQYLSTALALPDGTAALLAPLGGAGLVLVLTAANVAGARIAGATTAVLTTLPLVGLAGMFALGLASGGRRVQWPDAPFAPPDGPWALAFGAAMLPVFFTYSGWNAAAYVAGEVRDPGRNLPRGLLLGTAVVTALYLALVGMLVGVLSPERLAGSTTAGADAARHLLGPSAERALALCVAFAVLGSANVTLMAGARVYYAVARDGLAPRVLARTNRAGVPHVALWAGGVWSATLAVTGSVAALVSWATLAILLLSAATAVSLFVLRRRDATPPPYRCTGYPVTPVVYLVATLAVAAASTVADPLRAAKGLALLALGVPVYLVARRRAGSRGGGG